MLVVRLADPTDVSRIVEALDIAADAVADSRAPLASRFRTIGYALADAVDGGTPDRVVTVRPGDCVCGVSPVVVEAHAVPGTWLLVVDQDGVRLERVGTDMGTPG